MNDLIPTLAKARTGPICGACNGPALAQWQRRLTPDEYTAETAILQDRWDKAFELRDQSKPDPIQPPMPDAGTYTRAVYACGSHAIAMAGAARIHQNTCSGPNSPALPRCDCTPEPLPAQTQHTAAAVPEHWATAMAAGA